MQSACCNAMWLVVFVCVLQITSSYCQRVTIVTTESGENFELLIKPDMIQMYDDVTRSVNVTFQLIRTSNESTILPPAIDSATITASVYSEWTATLEGEQQMNVAISECANQSLCGYALFTVRAVRLGRAVLFLVLKFQRNVDCAAGESAGKSQCASQIVATARRTVPVAVVHERDVFDMIFRYVTIAFVLFLTFLMGTQLNIYEVVQILRRPLAPCVGIACQYVAMPLLAIGICQLFFVIPSAYSVGWTAVQQNVTGSDSNLGSVEEAVSAMNEANEKVRNAMLAFGLLALGCAPGGGASNTWTVLLGGDLQLSMTLTFLSTVLSFGMMPFWLFTLTPFILRHLPRSADVILQVDAYKTVVELPADEMSAEHQFRVPYVHIVYQLTCFVLPCVAGVLLRKFRPRAAARFRIPLKCFSGFFVLFMVTYGMWVHRYVFRVLADDPRLLAFTAALPHLGYAVGYVVTFIALRHKPRSIAVAIETGVQNMSIAVLVVKYNLPSPASDLGTVVLILVALVGPLALYIIFSVMLIRRRCAKHQDMLRESNEALDALHIELTGAKLTEHDLARLEKEAKLDAVINDNGTRMEKETDAEASGKLMANAAENA